MWPNEILVQNLKKWNSVSMINGSASMFSLKKQKLSNYTYLIVNEFPLFQVQVERRGAYQVIREHRERSKWDKGDSIRLGIICQRVFAHLYA